jgi:D-arabinose 1-dehydrogenase-like Zn-dependent alcohol dehydrogenase
MGALRRRFDFILCCASGGFTIGSLTPLLKPRKAVCIVGLPAVDTPLSFLPFDVVAGEKMIVGSFIGSTRAQQDMLEFSRAQNIMPLVEVIDLEQCNAGFGRLRDGSARYRMVLRVEGFRERMAAQIAALEASQ